MSWEGGMGEDPSHLWLKLGQEGVMLLQEHLYVQIRGVTRRKIPEE